MNKLKFTTLKQVLFYLNTKSPINSKLTVLAWFLIRLPLRTIFGWKKSKTILNSLENRKLISKMQDSAIFISRLEELSNFYEIYGEKKQELFEVPWRKNPIIIDVGAHIGVYSIKNALKFPEGKVIAIEPEKNNYNALTLNKRLNMLQNLLPYNLALSDKSGKLKLYLDELGSGQHSIIAKTDNFEEVKTKTMDDFIKDIKLKNIDLIKIDVEGAEYKVLQGAKGIIKKYYPTFVIELHPWNTPRIDKKIENLLSSYGYNLVEFKGEFIIFAYK